MLFKMIIVRTNISALNVSGSGLTKFRVQSSELNSRCWQNLASRNAYLMEVRGWYLGIGYLILD